MKKLSILLTVLVLVGLVSCASTGSASVETGIINTSCPIQGEPINEEKVVEYQGYKIGLCCDMCMSGWENLPADQKDAILADLIK